MAAGLCTAVAFNSPAIAWGADAAATKDENVYVTLGQDGSVSGIYVINEFSSEEGGEISDYGKYSSLKNLIDESEIKMENGHITADMPKGKFYYQGNMDSGEIPWNISICYFLDGEEISADELAGKSGDLKIKIQTGKNSDGDETFFENYLLQATVVLNTEKCSQIQAEGVTAGNVGVNRQLVYTIMPGEKKEIEITAKVQEFEMEGITFQGVPMSLGISEDMLDEVDLTAQTKELTDAVAQLDDGVGELKKGTKAATDGGTQLAEGIGQLTKGTSALNTGGSALAQGTTSLLDGTKALSGGLGQYTDGVDGFAAGVKQYVAGVEMLTQGATMLSPLENLPLVDDAVVQMYQAVAVGDKEQGIPSLQEGAESLSTGLHMIAEQVKLLENSTDAEKLQEMMTALGQLQAMTAELSETLGQISGVIGGSADMIDSVVKSHQEILSDVNNQVTAANQQISDAGTELAEKVNQQIDKNNAAVDAANSKINEVDNQVAGVNSQISAANSQINQAKAELDQVIASLQSDPAVSETEKADAIARLNALKNSLGSIDQISGSEIKNIEKIETVENPDVTISPVQMPEEDAAVRIAMNKLREISGELKDASEQFDQTSGQIKMMADSMAAALPDAGEGDEGQGNAIARLSQALSAACEGADGLRTGVKGVGAVLGQLSQNTSSFEETAQGITALNAGFEEVCKNNSLLLAGSEELTGAREELVAGTKTLVEGTVQLNSGTMVLAQGISVLSQGASLLDANTGTLTDGLAQLDEGTGKLKEGTEEFRKQTDNMDEKIQKEMEKLLDEVAGDNFEPVSFTSDKNTDIGLVQFAITAEGIKIQEEKEEPRPEEEVGFKDRLKQLFQ